MQFIVKYRYSFSAYLQYEPSIISQGNTPRFFAASVGAFHLKSCKLQFEGSFQVKCPHRSCKYHSGSFPVTSLTVHRQCTTVHTKTEYDKSNHCFHGQSGIWVKFQHLWPKNDGEKWSRKNIFEIPPCDHLVIFITEFVLLTKTPPFYEVNSFNRKW